MKSKRLQRLTFKAAVYSLLPLVSVTTSAWDFFSSELIEIIWPALPVRMSHRHSWKLLDFTLQLRPIVPYHYTEWSRKGRSPMRAIAPKNGDHCQQCGHPPLLPAVAVLLTNDCRQIGQHPRRTGGRVWTEPARPGPASMCRNVTSIRLMREDQEARQIQLADCWGKWESAQWLSFMIPLWVIPLQNENQAMKFMECGVILNRQVSKLHYFVQLLNRKEKIPALLFIRRHFGSR